MFPLFLDKGKQKNEEFIQKLLTKYMDKNYDMIFIVGNVNENVDLEKAHENYQPVFETTVISKKETLNN